MLLGKVLQDLWSKDAAREEAAASASPTVRESSEVPTSKL